MISDVRRRTRRRVATAAVVLVALAGVTAYAQTRPDPTTEAVQDGCKRARIPIFLGAVPNWVYVNDRAYPASGPPPPLQWVKGYVRTEFEPWAAAQPTAVDMPTTHSSFDFVANVDADPAYQFLIAGDPARRTGNFKDRNAIYARLHTEREEASFPTWAWPAPGDRVEMKGSWVWDCDHSEGGEHAEMHPPSAVWVRRSPGRVSSRSPFGEAEGDLFISTDKTPAGTQADCAHRSKGDETLFRACVRSDTNWRDVSGTYSFFLRAPPRPSAQAKLRVRVVDRGTTRGIRVRAVTARGGARVSVTLAATPDRRLVVAKQIFVGWTPTPAARLPEHLRVTIRRLTVRRAMDPGCPPGQQPCASPQTTRGDQISRGPAGEYVLYADVGGAWRPWSPRVVRARDGQTVASRQVVDVFVPRGRPWRIFVTGRECDNGLASSRGQRPLSPCPPSQEFAGIVGDDDPGHVLRQFRSPAAARGLHRADARLDGSSCPLVNRRGCYSIEFEVRRIDDAAARAARLRAR